MARLRRVLASILYLSIQHCLCTFPKHIATCGSELWFWGRFDGRASSLSALMGMGGLTDSEFRLVGHEAYAFSPPA